MYDIQFACPLQLRNNTHVRDAQLWEWVETQSACTVEDICVCESVSNNEQVVQVLFADNSPTAAQLVDFLQQFAAHFGK